MWTAPDVKEAKRLVRRSGTKGMRVVFVYPPIPRRRAGAPLADYMVELLTDLGYRGSVKPIPYEDWEGFGGSPRNQFQMTVGNWAADYPAASNFIAPFFACDAPASTRVLRPGDRCDDREGDRGTGRR